jgi:hypothetical protein
VTSGSVACSEPSYVEISKGVEAFCKAAPTGFKEVGEHADQMMIEDRIKKIAQFRLGRPKNVASCMNAEANFSQLGRIQTRTRYSAARVVSTE